MFSKKSKKAQLIFIVEDNKIYAKTLEAFLKLKFAGDTKVETYPVGEVCIDNLYRNPDFIIMDYYLNSRFYDAANGFEMAKLVKKEKPKTHVIVLSSQNSVEVASDTVRLNCEYIIKNDDAYEKVGNFIGLHYK